MKAKTMRAESGDRWEKAKWYDSYNVGNESIDEDHKRLFNLFNEFVTAVNERRGETEIQGVLNDLLEYTDYHFDREERLMRDSGFPDYKAHKSTHDTFVNELHDVNKAMDAGGEQGAYVLSVLAEWLTGHILTVDNELGVWLAEHGAAKAA